MSWAIMPVATVYVKVIIIGLFNIAAKGWIEQYAISRMQAKIQIDNVPKLHSPKVQKQSQY